VIAFLERLAQQADVTLLQGSAAPAASPLVSGTYSAAARGPPSWDPGPASRDPSNVEKGDGDEDVEDETDRCMHEAVVSSIRDEGRSCKEGSGGQTKGLRAGSALLSSVLPARKAATRQMLAAAQGFAAAVSMVQLVLVVRLTRLEGQLIAWLPPPPSNRLWVSFATTPKIELGVEPSLAGRSPRHAPLFRRVSSWVEGRLQRALQSTLVFPASFDLAVPLFGDAECSELARGGEGFGGGLGYGKSRGGAAAEVRGVGSGAQVVG